MEIPETVGGLATWEDAEGGEHYGIVVADLIADEKSSGSVLVAELPPATVKVTTAAQNKADQSAVDAQVAAHIAKLDQADAERAAHIQAQVDAAVEAELARRSALPPPPGPGEPAAEAPAPPEPPPPPASPWPRAPQ